jgi:NADPH:quinone reductase-like Zn-dependent oxidoreductase
MPDTHESCARRETTISAPQALTYMNSETVFGWAREFAGRVLKDAGADVNKEIELAYRHAYTRPPTGSERDTALTFFGRHKQILAERSAAKEKLALPAVMPEGITPEQAAALVDFCHMLLNSNELVYRN